VGFRGESWFLAFGVIWTGNGEGQGTGRGGLAVQLGLSGTWHTADEWEMAATPDRAFLGVSSVFDPNLGSSGR
jgi:hypothetical protein